MPALQNLDIVQGRGFTEADEEHASHVAIIGTDIQDHLFEGVDPLGQELRVDGTPYTVIGISEKQGSTFGASQDNWVGGAADGVSEELWDGEDADDLCEGGRGRTGAGDGGGRGEGAGAVATA